MNTLEQFKAAEVAARTIIEGFKNETANTPDAVEARKAELTTLKKDELVALIIGLEKPKADHKVKVADVAKALLCDPACAILPYDSIAAYVKEAIPDAETTGKAIASYKSKNGAEWNVVDRQKLVINPADLLKAANQ